MKTPNTPTEEFTHWIATLKEGYYWVENIGWDDLNNEIPIHRIEQVVRITPYQEDSKYGYWRGELVMAGLYVLDGMNLRHPSYYADWQGFRAELVTPPSFVK